MMAKVRPARADDLENVLRLLEEAELPAGGVKEHLSNFLVAPTKAGLAGAVGLEVYESVGLLRSLAVAEDLRGTGVGAKLVGAVLAKAKKHQLETVYLLTTTAETYFARFGFERVGRQQLDPRLQASKELQGLCPQTAVCMRLRLT